MDAARTTGSFLLVANLPFWIAGHFFSTATRPFFNLDYLFIALAGLFLPAWLYVSGVVVLLVVDVLLSSAACYYFNEHDLVSSLRFLSLLPWKRTAGIGVCLLGIALVWALLTIRLAGTRRHPQNRKVTGMALLSVTLLLMAVVVLNGSSSLRGQDLLKGPKVATSQCWKFARTLWRVARPDSTEETPIPVPSASAQLLEHLLTRPGAASGLAKRPNLVFIVMESYGRSNDPKLARLLDSPFQSPDILKKYEVQDSTVAFHGATVPAEFRELCGLDMGLKSLALVRQISPQCLPALLRQSGYETEAIHGFTGYMFDRRNWYRDLGFERRLFLDDLRRLPAMHMCGASFPGICDSDIARMIGDQLVSASPNRPQFVYWLTLNSHLPTVFSRENAAVLGCGSRDGMSSDAAVCNYLGIIYNLNVTIARLVARPDLPPTAFIIAGDHAPPFLAVRRRIQFSQSCVPFVRLWPKDDSAALPLLALERNPRRALAPGRN